MKLRYSTTSPFVRKVTMMALETGLDDRIERVPTNPWDADSDLPSDNPLGKVPALVTDDGQTLFESGLICEYLDSLHDGQKLFPAGGAARWRALRDHALANGILEAAVLCLIENKRRPAEVRWADWSDRQTDKIRCALDSLDAEAAGLDRPLDIGTISVAAALDYLDFRFPDIGWRDGRGALQAWYDTFSQRDSFQATRPHEPS